MARERLSALDAAFLELEGPRTPMHISSLTIFKDGPADVDEIRTALEQRIHRVPRFRQKVAQVPFRQGRPVWVDDPTYDVEQHVRHIALPSPGSEEQLMEVCGDILSRPLDRDRPLWDIHVIDSLEGGRFAKLSKVHHAMVDGIAGEGILELLLSSEPDPEPVEPATWDPDPEPGAIELLTTSMLERIARPTRLLTDVFQAVAEPEETVAQASRYLRGTVALARAALDAAPPSPLNEPVKRRRRFEIARGSLDVYKRIAQKADAKVNDVVLTCVAGGLREWCIRRQDDPCDLEVMVPVSIRDEDSGSFGNRVGMMITRLPVDEPDPVLRLEKVKDAAGRAKQENQAMGAEFLTDLWGRIPTLLLPLIGRLWTTKRLFNVLVTNIPGPRSPLYSVGKRMVELFPQAPLAPDQALSVGVFSYEGRMGYGLLADREALPDVGVIARGIEEAERELAAGLGLRISEKVADVAPTWSHEMAEALEEYELDVGVNEEALAEVLVGVGRGLDFDGDWDGGDP